MKKNNYKKGFSLIELTMVVVITSLLFVVFSVSGRVVENGRLINAINLTAQQPNIIENNKLALWLETSMPSREKKDGYKLLDWDDLSKNKILFMASDSQHYQTFKEKRTFPGIKSVYFDGDNPMVSKKSLNLSTYTIFVVSKPESESESESESKSESNYEGTIIKSGFEITANDVKDSLITVIRNDGTSKSIKSGLKEVFVGIEGQGGDILGNQPERIEIGSDRFQGEIFEIIVFDSVLDDDDVNKIEKYLYRKYIN